MCFFCCQVADMLTRFISYSSVMFEAVIYLCVAGIVFVLLYEVDKRWFGAKYRVQRNVG